MQSEEQMKELKEQLENLTKALNISFPDLHLGKEANEKPAFVVVNKVPFPDLKEPCVAKTEEPVPAAVVKKLEHPKPAPKPELAPRSVLATADEFLTEAAVYRNWLLKSTMHDKLEITPSHVELLRALITCVQELKHMEKEYPSKEASIDEITLFSE